VIKSGKVAIEYEDSTEILSPYQLAIFNPFENHRSICYDKNIFVEYHTIYFDLKRCCEIQKVTSFMPVIAHIIKNKELVSAFLTLHNMPDKEKEMQFLQKLFTEYTSDGVLLQNDFFIEKIMLYIQDHDTTLEEITKYFNISKSHLIRRFKQSVGISVHAYILNHKVHKGKRLLKVGMPIAEAALEAGFYDQSHFHKAFQSVFAMTPKEFQKSYFLQD